MPTGVYKRTPEMKTGKYKHPKQCLFQKGHKINLGKKHTEKTKQKIGIGNSGSKSWRWKDDASYSALHHWVRKYKGKAKICEDCGKKKTTPKSVQWCNKDHKYRRNLDDYISLCVPCHRKYDKKLSYQIKGEE